MREEDRRRVGILVRQARERRGLAQVSLAQLSGMSDRWVMDLELGRVDPRIGDLGKLEAVLGVELVALAGGKMPAEDDTRRRTFVVGLAAMPLVGVDFERLAAANADRAYLEDAEAVSVALAAARRHIRPENLIPAILGHLHDLEARLPATSELTARTAVVAGMALIEAGRDADSYRAQALAIGLGSRPVQAKALGGQARVYSNRGDYRAALVHQDHAVTLAKGTDLAGSWARRAELRAEAGDDSGAMRDLEAAGRAIAGRTWAWWMHNPQNEVDLGAYRGSVLATLGRDQEAVDAYEWVLGRMDADKTLWRAKIAQDRDRALAAL